MTATVTYANYPLFRAEDNNNDPLVGGKLYSYTRGTSTPKATYSNSGLSSANTNPIILNARGETSYPVYLNGATDLILKDASGVAIWGPITVGSGAGATNINTNTTIPAGVVLTPANGDIYNIATGVTLTINGRLEAGSYQIFNCTGTGQVVFGPGSVDYIRPEWGNATGTGSAAFQWAIDTAAASTCKKIKLTGDAYTYNTPINVTSGSDIERSGIMVEGSGRRAGTTIYANTGDICFELTGSAWTSWHGLYIKTGLTNPSRVGFFMAGTTTNTECLYHDFERVFVELYKADITGLTYGSVGYMVMGSEENTWDKTQTYASTPFIFSSGYTGLATEFPSYFRNGEVLAGHSCGVNTFSGENMVVTFDKKCPNIVLYGANTPDFGNMYLGNVNVGTPGTNQTAINVIGGSLENLRGRFKVEGQGTILELTGGSMWNWDVAVAYGAVADATVANPVVLIHTDSAAVVDLQHLNLQVTYVDPTDTPFVGKKIFDTTGTPNLTPVLSGISVKVNQTRAQYNTTPFPAWFCGLTRNFTLEWADAKYFMDANRHVLTPANRIYMGAGNNATPTDIAKVYLPAITANKSARSIAVRLKGMMTTMNTAGDGSEVAMTNCIFDTSRGAYSIKDGAIVIGNMGAASDDLINASTVTALSNDAANYLYTGVNMGLVYDAPTRTIQINALTIGSGANLAGVLAFMHSPEIEMLTVGVVQELIYLQ